MKGQFYFAPFSLSPAAAKGELSERGTGDSLRLGDPPGRKRVGKGRGFIYSTSVLFFFPCAGSDCPNERTNGPQVITSSVTKAPLSEVGGRQWLRLKSPPQRSPLPLHPGYATHLSSRLERGTVKVRRRTLFLPPLQAAIKFGLPLPLSPLWSSISPLRQ